MMDSRLFDTSLDFDADLVRNIVSLRESEDLFDDLSDGDADLSAVAAEAEMRVKRHFLPDRPDIIQRGFHYTTAIEYPFRTESYLSTRYGDGTFGVWYGSLDLETTVYETAYHMIRAELGVEGLEDIIVRERAVYNVRCRAIAIDLRDKAKAFPELTADDYEFTQALGRRFHREGHPAVLYPSARCKGDNMAVFNAAVLRNPRQACYLKYLFDPVKIKLTVQRKPGRKWMVIDGPLAI